MSNVNRVILTIGSNLDSEDNIECAIMELQAHFISIHFSEPVYTQPSDEFPDAQPFWNQVGVGYTAEDPTGLRELFDEIHQLLGRNLKDDKDCRIPIDINLLLWNNQNFKPDLMRVDYILTAVRSLLHKSL